MYYKRPENLEITGVLLNSTLLRTTKLGILPAIRSATAAIVNAVTIL